MLRRIRGRFYATTLRFYDFWLLRTCGTDTCITGTCERPASARWGHVSLTALKITEITKVVEWSILVGYSSKGEMLPFKRSSGSIREWAKLILLIIKLMNQTFDGDVDTCIIREIIRKAACHGTWTSVGTRGEGILLLFIINHWEYHKAHDRLTSNGPGSRGLLLVKLFLTDTGGCPNPPRLWLESHPLSSSSSSEPSSEVVCSDISRAR